MRALLSVVMAIGCLACTQSWGDGLVDIKEANEFVDSIAACSGCVPRVAIGAFLSRSFPDDESFVEPLIRMHAFLEKSGLDAEAKLVLSHFERSFSKISAETQLSLIQKMHSNSAKSINSTAIEFLLKTHHLTHAALAALLNPVADSRVPILEAWRNLDIVYAQADLPLSLMSTLNKATTYRWQRQVMENILVDVPVGLVYDGGIVRGFFRSFKTGTAFTMKYRQEPRQVSKTVYLDAESKPVQDFARRVIESKSFVTDSQWTSLKEREGSLISIAGSADCEAINAI